MNRHNSKRRTFEDLSESETADVGCGIPVVVLLLVGGVIAFWKNPGPFAATPLVLASCFVFMGLHYFYPDRGFLKFAVMALLLSLLMYTLMNALREISDEGREQVFGYITDALRRLGNSAGVVGTVVVAGIAYGLYYLKRRQLLLYAYLEIILAMISCNVAVERAKTRIDLASVAVVAASIYFLVRGLENRQSGLLSR